MERAPSDVLPICTLVPATSPLRAESSGERMPRGMRRVAGGMRMFASACRRSSDAEHTLALLLPAADAPSADHTQGVPSNKTYCLRIAWALLLTFLCHLKYMCARVWCVIGATVWMVCMGAWVR